MSDISDDDELANNYGPTTPAPPKKAPRQRAGSTKPVAGPSTKPSKTTAPRKPATKTTPILPDDDGDEDVVIVEPTKKRKVSADHDAVAAGNGAARKTTARAVPAANGITKATTAAGKGKGKAPAEKVNGGLHDTMDVDQETALKPDEPEPQEPPVPRVAKLPKKGGVTAAAMARQAKVEEKLRRENESLRAQLEQLRESKQEIAGQRDKLVAQLEELFRVRQTDAEQALMEYKSYYDESMKRKESLVQELTTRLTKLQSPSSKSEQSYSLHFLTRDAAEEEKRALKEEANRYKEVVKQRDAMLAGKDEQIAALQEETVTLKKERDAEIERSKSLAMRAPVPLAAAKPTQIETKNAPVIRLYEDMTNVLVTSVRLERSPDWPDVEEEVFSCLYTYNNTGDDIHFTLHFLLRNVYDRPEDCAPEQRLTKDQLVVKVQYTPQDLDKEPPEITEHLDFMKGPFLFSREQMPVFLKTMTERISGLFEGTSDGDIQDEIIDVDELEL